MKIIIFIGLLLIPIEVFADDKIDKRVNELIAEAEKAKKDKAKEEQAAYDKVFLSNPIKNFLFTSLKLKGKLGYTDSSGINGEGNATPVHFKSDEKVWKAQFGYFGKQILRDIYLAGGQSRIDRYRDKKGKAFRYAFIDAVKFDLNVGYGETLTDQGGIDNFTTKEKSTYYVGISYAVPLGKTVKATEFKE